MSDINLKEKGVNIWAWISHNGYFYDHIMDLKSAAYKSLKYVPDISLCSACEQADVDRMHADKPHSNICHFCPCRGSWLTEDGKGMVEFCLSKNSCYIAVCDAVGKSENRESIQKYAKLVAKTMQEAWVE